MQGLSITKIDPTAKELAVLIRAALKVAFNGVKFSVRKTDWNTVCVSYTDGPTTDDVRLVMSRFGRSGGTDMGDCPVFEDGDLVMTANGPVLYAFRGYTFVFRTISDTVRANMNAIFDATEADKFSPTGFGEGVLGMELMSDVRYAYAFKFAYDVQV